MEPAQQGKQNDSFNAKAFVTEVKEQLAQEMSELLTTGLQYIKEDIKIEHKKVQDELFSFQKQGNRKQFEFVCQLDYAIEKAKKELSKGSPREKVHDLLCGVTEKLQIRKQHIKWADSSQVGWEAINSMLSKLHEQDEYSAKDQLKLFKQAEDSLLDNKRKWSGADGTNKALRGNRFFRAGGRQNGGFLPQQETYPPSLQPQPHSGFQPNQFLSAPAAFPGAFSYGWPQQNFAPQFAPYGGRFIKQKTAAILQKRQGPCFRCGGLDHWQDECGATAPNGNFTQQHNLSAGTSFPNIAAGSLPAIAGPTGRLQQ